MAIVGKDLLRAFYKLFYLQFCDLSDQLNFKSFARNLREIFTWNNRNYNSYRFSYKFGFIHFLYFLTNQKQESGFKQVGSLTTKNISVFCLWQVALYFIAMPNSIDF